MYEIYYHEITREFLAHLKVSNQQLDERLSVSLENDIYMLHLEFNENGATLGFFVRNLAKSELAPLYVKIIERIENTEQEFMNIGVSIFQEQNLAINTYIPNSSIDSYELINFYEYVNNELLQTL